MKLQAKPIMLKIDYILEILLERFFNFFFFFFFFHLVSTLSQYVIFKRRAAVFYRVSLKNTRRSRVFFDPIKHVLRVF